MFYPYVLPSPSPLTLSKPTSQECLAVEVLHLEAAQGLGPRPGWRRAPEFASRKAGPVGLGIVRSEAAPPPCSLCSNRLSSPCLQAYVLGPCSLECSTPSLSSQLSLASAVAWAILATARRSYELPMSLSVNPVCLSSRDGFWDGN